MRNPLYKIIPRNRGDDLIMYAEDDRFWDYYYLHYRIHVQKNNAITHVYDMDSVYGAFFTFEGMDDAIDCIHKWRDAGVA